MRFCALFTTLLSLRSYSLLAEDAPDIYGIEKNLTVKHPDSISQSEHGKWDILLFRPFLRIVMKLIGLLLAPFKWVFNEAVVVIEDIIPESKGLDTNRSFCNGVLEEFKTKVQLIKPGTKWCGPGDVAQDYEDVGVLANSDKCCRRHDSCPKDILAGLTKYGLKNTGLFTRSLCACDGDFYNCLKKVNSPTSRSLGVTYFNVLGPQCFELVNCSDPSVKCRNRQTNGTQYQWSDNPRF